MPDLPLAAESQPATTATDCRFLTFNAGGRRYALPAETISEVIPVPPAARLPYSPKCLMGLANLRGVVIPVIDLRSMLGMDGLTRDSATRAIVLLGPPTIALVVDVVERLVSVAPDRVETRQAGAVAEPGELLLGAFPGGTLSNTNPQTGTDSNVVRILDLPAMLAAAFGDRPGPRLTSRPPAAAPEAAVATAVPVERRLLISFDVAGQDYALALDAVREIIPLPATIAVVPRAEAVLLGVTIWRDTLLPLLSLRGLLGFPPAAAWTGREKVFVTGVNGASVGLVADQARALIRADVAAIDPAPAMLAARSGGESRISAIFRGQGGQKLVSLLAPEQLFREDVMRRIGDSLLPSMAAPTNAVRGAPVQFVVFRLGDEEFGLPIAAVDEVARVPGQITRVPKMPEFLEGVINLRGEVLPIIDQRRRFDMPKLSGGRAQRLIVVRADRHRAGLIVDHVSEVFRTEASTVEPAPDLSGDGGRLVNGVINARLTGRMILLLDPAELLTRVEQRALDQLDLRDGTFAVHAAGSAPNELNVSGDL